eukprot:GEMP01020749.1.p1 GENE.GEMP01020749.1~~GEMP01020749.1.p1  ORF type:complete len:663 (+),score=128.50 GEMP01020749.1:183-2171(+)
MSRELPGPDSSPARYEYVSPNAFRVAEEGFAKSSAPARHVPSHGLQSPQPPPLKSGFMLLDEPSSQPTKAATGWETVFIGTGVGILLMLASIPIWNAISLLEDTNFVFWNGGSVPVWILTILMFLLAAYVLSITAFFKYANPVHRTEQTVMMMVTAFVTLFGLVLVIMAIYLSLQVGESSNNLMWRCSFSKQTRAVYDEWEKLYGIRRTAACANKDSVESCSGYRPTDESAYLKYMENNYQCVGFCYSGTTVLIHNNQSVAGSINLRLEIYGSEGKRVACIAASPEGESRDYFRQIADDPNSASAVIENGEAQLSITKDTGGYDILEGVKYMARCADEHDKSIETLPITPESAPSPIISVTNDLSITGEIKFTLNTNLENGQTVICTAAGDELDFKSISDLTNKVTVTTSGNSTLVAITADLNGDPITNKAYVVSCGHEPSGVFTHAVTVGPFTVQDNGSAIGKLLVKITSKGLNDGVEIDCVNVKEGSNATRADYAAIHADTTKQMAQIAGNAATLEFPLDTDGAGIIQGVAYEITCADASDHKTSTTITIPIASFLHHHKKRHHHHDHDRHHSILRLALSQKMDARHLMGSAGVRRHGGASSTKLRRRHWHAKLLSRHLPHRRRYLSRAFETGDNIRVQERLRENEGGYQPFLFVVVDTC